MPSRRASTNFEFFHTFRGQQARACGRCLLIGEPIKPSEGPPAYAGVKEFRMFSNRSLTRPCGGLSNYAPVQ